MFMSGLRWIIFTHLTLMLIGSALIIRNLTPSDLLLKGNQAFDDYVLFELHNTCEMAPKNMKQQAF